MMKRIALFCLLLFIMGVVYAQEENGTVYKEHEAIEKTRALWTSFTEGDKSAYQGFFADSVFVFVNGKMNPMVRSEMGANIDWWQTEVKNLKVGDHKPAYPDAIEYSTSGTWVQDWIKVEGIHIKTGIHIDMHLHNLYSFNEEGKVTSMHHYFDNSVLEEITNSTAKRENGKVYINHPYIVTVRKMINAFVVDRDVDSWASYCTPNARFSSLAQKMGEWKDLDTRKAELKKMLDDGINFKLEQIGYPDCIYYAKNDNYVVYSWWNVTRVQGDSKIVYPLMLTHNFNKEGKVSRVNMYFSTNHMEE